MAKVLCAPKSLSSPSAASTVAVLWDLSSSSCSIPTKLPLSDAAVRLRLFASSFGRLLFSVGFPSASPVRLPTHADDALSFSPSKCRICGRNFFSRPNFLSHFETIHTREHQKRLARLSSARGSRLVRLRAALSLKISKYEAVAKGLSSSSLSSNIADHLLCSGFKMDDDNKLEDVLRTVIEKPRMGCIVLVSNDAKYTRELLMAREGGVRTVVVVGGSGGKHKGLELKRHADAGFTWEEVVSGKARRAAPAAISKWMDRKVMKRLEWRYEGGNHENDVEMEEDAVFDGDEDVEQDEMLNHCKGQREDGGRDKAWWKLDDDQVMEGRR